MPAQSQAAAQDRTTNNEQGQTPQVNRTMSIEMADVSNLSIQSNPQTRQGSADEERMREKAREAHEQVCLSSPVLKR